VGRSRGQPCRRHSATAVATNTASATATAGPAASATSTSTCGISADRRTPNDRTVRSWTSPSSDTASPSEHTQPSAAWTAPMQYERRTTRSSGAPASTCTRTRPASIEHRLGPTGGPEVHGGGRAGHVELLHGQVGCRERHGCGQAGGPGDTQQPGPVGAHPTGHGRTLGAPAGAVLAGPPQGHPLAAFVGERPGGGRQRAGPLAAERPAVRRRRGRVTPGFAPGAVGLQVGRVDPGGPQGPVPVALGELDRRHGFERRPAALHRPGRPTSRREVRRDDPAVRCVRIGHTHRCPVRNRVRCEPRSAEHDLGTDPLWGAEFEGGTFARRLLVPGHGVDRPRRHQLRGLDDRLPAGAAAQVGGERPVHGGPVVERPTP
jgi:hypothetical protein